MAMQWPVSKLDCINRALADTGQYPVAVLEDGSREYNVCSPAYEDGLACLTEEANWGFCTKVVVLQPDPVAPADTDWDTAYPLPNDMIHIVWLKINYSSSSNQRNFPVMYDILNNQIVVNSRGGPPQPVVAVTPFAITLKYASSNNVGPEIGTPLFVRALTLYVMAGIYRGLKHDAALASKTFGEAEQIAQKARTRYDMQKPKRSLFRSQVSRARYTRCPSGVGWDGNYPR